MRRLLSSLLLFLALALALPIGASASIPAGDGPAPSTGQDRDPNRVHKLKPWQPQLKYRMSRAASAYAELNARSGAIAQTVKDQWWPIDCQLFNETQNGVILWNHIPGVGWVADGAMQTFSDGRLQGAPTCAKPAPNHVWFKQPWRIAKEYRITRDVQVLDRPGGAPVATRLPAGSWIRLNCAVVTGGATWFLVDPAGPTSGFILADAVNRWQDGIPAGMGRCVSNPTPLRTYAAIGDSYASGLGVPGAEESGCRRSSLAYFGLLRGSLKQGITTGDEFFQACAGDTSTDILKTQMDALDPTTRVVTLSAGGNDFNFPTIVKACVTPDLKDREGCDDAVRKYTGTDDVARVRAALKTLYAEVRDQAPYARVYVMGYPEVVDPDDIDGCLSLSDGDGPLLHETAVKVDRTVRSAIGNRRGFRFVGLVDTFKDHPACKDNSTDWINGVVSLSGPGALESFHPNKLGHEAIARKLRQVAPQYFG